MTVSHFLCLKRLTSIARYYRRNTFGQQEGKWLLKKICKRAIWIEKGHIRDDGPSDIVGTEFERAYYAGELSE